MPIYIKRLITVLAFFSTARAAVSGDLPEIIHSPDKLPIHSNAKQWAEDGLSQWIYDLNNPNKMVVQQNTDKAIFNWDSFNIGRDNEVEFKQPNESSIALNRIHDSNPSNIFGSLTANGQIYLINPNGILFGEKSQVNVHSLVASTLNISDEVFNAGIARALPDLGKPAFENSEAILSKLEIEKEATIQSANGGSIMLLAPEIENAGNIETPEGQTILAAGDKVWVVTDESPELRGLIVEVSVDDLPIASAEFDDEGQPVVDEGIPATDITSGKVVNDGVISATRGNVSLVGTLIRQNGTISATSSISKNGSIYLSARKNPVLNTSDQSIESFAEAGQIVIGKDSLTEIEIELDELETATDSQPFNPSVIALMGKEIAMEARAKIIAPAGKVSITATESPQPNKRHSVVASEANDSAFHMAASSEINVSGTDSVVLSMERNLVEVELRGNELKDVPVQRDGPLNGQKVVIDSRYGTSVADVSSTVELVTRSGSERASIGGTITIKSEGKLVIEEGAILDVSGGKISYESGLLSTTKLITGNKVVDISVADPAQSYDRIFGKYIVENPKWGIKEEYQLFDQRVLGVFEEGYVEGKDAGSIEIWGRDVELAGNFRGSIISGKWQRNPAHDLSNLPAWARPFNQVPAAGKLSLGTSTLGVDKYFPGIVIDDNPGDNDYTQSSDVLLSSQQFMGFTSLNFLSNGRVTLAESSPLQLPSGATFNISAVSVDILSNVNVAGGNISLKAEASKDITTIGESYINLADGIELNTSGIWVNDYLGFNDRNPPTLHLDGGNISLDAKGIITLGEDSALKANGGAWLSIDQDFLGGSGGDIKISSSLEGGTDIILDGTVESYSFAQGGKLSIQANGFFVTEDITKFQQSYFVNNQLTSKNLLVDGEKIENNEAELFLPLLIPLTEVEIENTDTESPQFLSLTSYPWLVEYLDPKYITEDKQVNLSAMHEDNIKLNPAALLVFDDAINLNRIINLSDYVDAEFVNSNNEVNLSAIKQNGLLVNKELLVEETPLIDAGLVADNKQIEFSQIEDVTRLLTDEYLIKNIRLTDLEESGLIVNPQLIKPNSIENIAQGEKPFVIDINLALSQRLAYLVDAERWAGRELTPTNEIENIIDALFSDSNTAQYVEILPDFGKLASDQLIANPKFLAPKWELIAPEVFQSGGFTSYELSANFSGFQLTENTNLTLKASNYVLNNDYDKFATGSSVSDFTQIVELPDFLSEPVNLAIKSKRPELETDANISLAKNSQIIGEIGSTVSLTSDTDLYIDGEITAPAGDISLNLVNPNLIVAKDEFRPNQAIWLSEHSRLQASASAQFTPNPLGIRQGKMHDAGTININTTRGYIVTEAGSLLDVSGAKEIFDVYVENQTTEAKFVAGQAGSIHLVAAEGMYLNGNVDASAADLQGAKGGKLKIALDPNQRKQGSDFFNDASIEGIYYPMGAKIIEIVADKEQSSLDDLVFGDPLVTSEDLLKLSSKDENVVGGVSISTTLIRDGGFDDVELKTVPVTDSLSGGLLWKSQDSSASSSAEVHFNGDVDLALKNSLILDSPVVRGLGDSQIGLNSSYIRLGSTFGGYEYNPDPESGSADIAFNAQHIDLLGFGSMSGFDVHAGQAAQQEDYSIQLHSKNDIRLIGLAANGVDGGAFKFGDSVNLVADRIYPSTLTDFSLQAKNVFVESLSEAISPPISAGAKLTFDADRFISKGNILAPFGELVFGASDELIFADKSLTSVSGVDALVPFGTTEFGKNWIVNNGKAESFLTTAPQKNISFDAPNIDLQQGAIIDVRGGGDLFAYEFVPGPGGSKDILSHLNASKAFAIVPTQDSLFGLYDPFENLGFEYDIGTTVKLDGNSALPNGEFAVMPARYALLPDSYLVTPIGKSLTQMSHAGTEKDGTPFATGTFSFAHSSSEDTLLSLFRIESGDIIRNRAKYLETTAQAFFTEKSVNRFLPLDAGRLTIDADDFLEINSILISGSGIANRPDVEIVAENISIVEQRQDLTGRIELVANQLNNMGAGSLVIGGQRVAEDENGVTIESASQSIVLEKQVILAAEEVILASQNEIIMRDSSQIQSLGQVADTSKKLTSMQFNNAGAIIRTANSPQVDIIHNNAAMDKGYIKIQNTARLESTNSIVVSGLDRIDLAGSVSLPDSGSLAIASKKVALGTNDNESGGVALNAERLESFNMSELILRSQGNIELYDGVSLGLTINNDDSKEIMFDRLVLDTIGIVGHNNTDDSIIAAKNIELTNSGSSVFNYENNNNLLSDDTNGLFNHGNLTFLTQSEVSLDNRLPDQGRLSVNKGQINFQGFDRVDFNLGQEFVLGNTAELVTHNAEVRIKTPRFTANHASNSALQIDGRLAIESNNNGAASNSDFGLGAFVQVNAKSLFIDSYVDLPSGSLWINLTPEPDANNGQVQGEVFELGDGGILDFSGIEVPFITETLTTPGGNLNITTTDGNILFEAGSKIDVSGHQNGGHGGSIQISAPNSLLNVAGKLEGDANDEHRSARINLDIESLYSKDGTTTNTNLFSSLNTRLNNGGFEGTSRIGFTGERKFRFRQGDIDIAANDTLESNIIEITADSGKIDIYGHLNASGTKAGEIRINAKDRLTVHASASLEARALGEDEAGGSVYLASYDGIDILADNAEIDTLNSTNTQIDIVKRINVEGTEWALVYDNEGMMVGKYEILQLLPKINPQVVYDLEVLQAHNLRLDEQGFVELYDAEKNAWEDFLINDKPLRHEQVWRVLEQGNNIVRETPSGIIQIWNSVTGKWQNEFFRFNNDGLYEIWNVANNQWQSNLSRVADDGRILFWNIDKSNWDFSNYRINQDNLIEQQINPALGLWELVSLDDNSVSVADLLSLPDFNPPVARLNMQTGELESRILNDSGDWTRVIDNNSKPASVSDISELLPNTIYRINKYTSNPNVEDVGSIQGVNGKVIAESIEGFLPATLFKHDQDFYNKTLFDDNFKQLLLANNYKIEDNKVYSRNTGNVHIRVPMGVNITVAEADTLDKNNYEFEFRENLFSFQQNTQTIWGAASIDLEAFAQFDITNHGIQLDSPAGHSPYRQLASLFFEEHEARGHLIFEQNHIAGDANYHLLPGIELRSDNDIKLNQDWDLFEWKFGKYREPGILSLRAANNIDFNTRLSDGSYATVESIDDNYIQFDQLSYERSWTYLITAGADLSSSDLLAVSMRNNNNNAGNINFNTNAYVFTGTGDISLAAADTITFSKDTSALYTSGRQVEGVNGSLDLNFYKRQLSRIDTSDVIYDPLTLSFTAKAYPVFLPEQGGEIDIYAGGDIAGNNSSQFYSQWLYRVGGIIANNQISAEFPTTWGVSPGLFSQNIASFAGGDIAVESGGKLKDLSISLPSLGRQDGLHFYDAEDIDNSFVVDNFVTEKASGDLSIYSWGNIEGGEFFVGKGYGSIITNSSMQKMNTSPSEMAPILALGDAKFDVYARESIDLESILNPTVLRRTRINSGNNLETVYQSYMFTYSDASQVRISALSGDVFLSNQINSSALGLGFTGEDSMALKVYPGSLSVFAHQGDILLRGSYTLFPSKLGTFDLFAQNSIRAFSGSPSLSLLDADSTLLPNPVNPKPDFVDASQRLVATNHANRPVHADDLSSAQVIALNGDIRGRGDTNSDTPLGFSVSKPLYMYAGNDIYNVSIDIQHSNEESQSVIEAGRDLIFPIVSGNSSNSRIKIAGPGDIYISTGRDVDLGNSIGIVSVGNSENNVLPKAGANISLTTGLEHGLDIDSFVASYLDTSDDNSAYLRQYFVTGNPYLLWLDSFVEPYRQDDNATTLEIFKSLPKIQQRGFIYQVLTSELFVSGTDTRYPDINILEELINEIPADELETGMKQIIQGYLDTVAQSDNQQVLDLAAFRLADVLNTLGNSLSQTQLIYFDDVLSELASENGEARFSSSLSVKDNENLGVLEDRLDKLTQRVKLAYELLVGLPQNASSEVNNTFGTLITEVDLAKSESSGCVDLWCGNARGFIAYNLLFANRQNATTSTKAQSDSYIDLLSLLDNDFAGGNPLVKDGLPTDEFYDVYFTSDGEAAPVLKSLIGVSTDNPVLAKIQMTALTTNIKLSKANEIADSFISQNGGLEKITTSLSSNKAIPYQDNSASFSVNNSSDIALFKSNPENFVELMLDGSYKNFGDLSLLFSQIKTQSGGNINLFIPHGSVDAGVAATDKQAKDVNELGITVRKTGDINALVGGDFLVNESRVFTAGGGDILLWSNFGDLDAGRGSKTAASVPTIRTTFNQDGYRFEETVPGIAGSGIRTASGNKDVVQGNVYLFAPNGQIRAGDAGIGGKDVFVKGEIEDTNNIDIAGESTGVPQEVSAEVPTPGTENIGNSVTESAEEGMNDLATESFSDTPLADEALSLLEVFVIEFGDDAEDEES